MRDLHGLAFAGKTAFPMLALLVLSSWAEPFVPAHHHLKAGKASEAEQGRMLIHELNCVACHQADAGPERLPPRLSPDLSHAGQRLTPQYIRALLKDPQSLRPGTSMPAMFHGLDEAQSSETIEALTHFLVSQGGPIIPSVMGGSPALAETGEKLFHEVGCVACHAPMDTLAQFPSASLANIERKTTVDQLVAFLKDPAHARPSGRMPDFRLRNDEAHALAVYLLRAQIDNAQATHAPPVGMSGVSYKYFTGNFVDREHELAAAKPVATGVTEGIAYTSLKHAAHSFAFVFEAKLRVDVPGTYTFVAESDDSAFIRLNGVQVVGIPGLHPMQSKSGTIDLEPGLHELQVIYCDGGGLQAFDVHWIPPGGKQSAIPADRLSIQAKAPMMPLNSEDFVLDPARVESGRAHFTRLRCVSCHVLADVAPTEKPLPALRKLRAERERGCLAESVKKGHPRFDLSPEQRSAIRAGLLSADTLAAPLSKAAQVEHTLAVFNCLACHTRGAIGGAGTREDYFHTLMDIDLGDEGRLPPTLTGVGSKLRASVLADIIKNGKHHVRPYMATRMPSFQHEAIDSLIKLLPEVDRLAGDETEPVFSGDSASAGRTLVGANGLGCVNCHNVAGNRSIGIPGIDLASTYPRLNPGWFARFLSNPAAFNPNTRMPGFWVNDTVAFKDVAGGTVAGQHAAIWNYLSLGDAMPLPKGVGVDKSADGLVPIDEPILLNTFIKDAGPRGIAIGYPEQVHVSFDGNTVRLTHAWKGQFFDPSGAWSDRNDRFNGPLGHDILAMPPGPSFTVLPSPDAPWPILALNDRFVGRFKGYTFDANRMPTLMYEHDGLKVEERPQPRLQQGGTVLLRQFALSGNAVPAGMHFLAAAGTRIDPVEPGIWSVDGSLVVTVDAPGMTPFVRTSGGVGQLLVPVVMNNNKARIEVVLKW